MGRGGATSQQKHLFEDYDGFVDKFKPKKTTDDCYTPPEVYEVVRDWACERFGIDPEGIVRPFYPGGDYEAFDYPDGCTVLDNPPFSILMQIKRFYLGNGTRFFLFCPGLTAFSGALTRDLTHILCDANITYENGAVVRTGFVTNLGGDVVAMSAPDLGERIREACERLRAGKVKRLPKLDYPDHVLTSARLQWMASHGTAFEVRRADCCFIRRLDAQERGSGIFGGGLLLSDRAAAESAAAKRAAAKRAAGLTFELSERERGIVEMLG